MSFLGNIKPEQTCLVPIDVQEMFCNPRYWSFIKFIQPWVATPRTDAFAHKIGSIAPKFNALSIDVAWVYYTEEYDCKKPFKMAGRLYGVKPAPIDAIIPKAEDSAFEDGLQTPFEKWLIDKNKTHIILCGFYLTACVYKTAMDAVSKGYKVTVLADLSTDGRRANEHQETHRTSICQFIDNVTKSSPKYARNIELSTSALALKTLEQTTLQRRLSSA